MVVIKSVLVKSEKLMNLTDREQKHAERIENSCFSIIELS
jgi:hypothetical protein